MDNLVDELKALIKMQPGLTGKLYAQMLSHQWNCRIDKYEVNRVLYSHYDIFEPNRNEWDIPAWTLTIDQRIKDIEAQLGSLQIRIDDYEKTRLSFKESQTEVDNWYSSLNLYAWQQRAINIWESNGYHGVIEAVTASGKTLVALVEMYRHLKQGWRIAILVPSLELQRQWVKKITEIFTDNGNYSVGIMGDGKSDTLDDCDILVATAHMANKNWMNPENQKALMIVDECHRFGAEAWARSLEDNFSRRMGLTATYEREDEGVEDYLTPYFSKVDYRYDYSAALSEGVIAPFEVYFIGVDLNEDEQIIYDNADDICKKTRSALVTQWGIPGEPFGSFMKETVTLSKEGGSGARLAQRYLNHFSKRRRATVDVSAKRDALLCLRNVVVSSQRTIVFTQTIEGAKDAADVFRSCGIRCAVLTAELDNQERQSNLESFKSGRIQLIAAPQLLDEGVDVPIADVAIIISASRTRRQMIQRMGRVLRKSGADKIAKIFILYARNTFEDPERGAHEAFIDMVTEACDKVEYLLYKYGKLYKIA